MNLKYRRKQIYPIATWNYYSNKVRTVNFAEISNNKYYSALLQRNTRACQSSASDEYLPGSFVNRSASVGGEEPTQNELQTSLRVSNITNLFKIS